MSLDQTPNTRWYTRRIIERKKRIRRERYARLDIAKREGVDEPTLTYEGSLREDGARAYAAGREDNLSPIFSI